MTAKIYQFRPFKVPRPVENQFFQIDNTNNERFMEEDLARSGLTSDDIHSYITSLIKKEGATAAYTIPYFGLDGNPIMDRDGFPVLYRTRFRLPEYSREQRYTQPNKEQLSKFDLPPFAPYIHPLTLALEGDNLVCCEGEKKTVSVLKHLGIPAFGIGGCQLWRNPDGSGTIHPWIRKLLAQRGGTSITIVPDGDIHRYDICNAYGNFARALENEGISVRILDPGGKIDDLIVGWGTEASQRWAELKSLEANDLVQSPDSLVKKYGLSFKRDSKDRAIVHQHTSNIMILMEEHNAFPKVWKNDDNSKIMLGEEAAIPNATEVEIANYFQHNLGFDKVNDRTIRTCVLALARRNAKSPFLDRVRSISWDGEKRLDTWMERLWGVAPSAFTKEVSSKWLISACARMDKPGTKLDWMLIVIGAQGTGKTSMPGIMFNGSNLTLYGEHNDKDLHMLLHSSLCVGFDELDSFGKRESSNLKAMVTRNEDAFRPPYGASVELFQRRFTLYGCGNRYEFLQHDPSGYRRYAVIEINRLLDFRGLEAERDQLWAEAWQRYQEGGVKYWEVEGASDQAQKYVITNTTQEKIEEFFYKKKMDKITPAGSNTIHFTMGELLQAIGKDNQSGNSSAIRDIAGILLEMGAVKPTKVTLHPSTGGRARWYTYEFKD